MIFYLLVEIFLNNTNQKHPIILSNKWLLSNFSLSALMSFSPLLSCPATWSCRGPVITKSSSTLSGISILSLLFNHSFLLTCCSILIATFLCLHEASNQLTDHFLPIPGVLLSSLSPCPRNFTNTRNSLTSLSLSFPFPVQQNPNLANIKHLLFHDKHLSS